MNFYRIKVEMLGKANQEVLEIRNQVLKINLELRHISSNHHHQQVNRISHLIWMLLVHHLAVEDVRIETKVI